MFWETERERRGGRGILSPFFLYHRTKVYAVKSAYILSPFSMCQQAEYFAAQVYNLSLSVIVRRPKARGVTGPFIFSVKPRVMYIFSPYFPPTNLWLSLKLYVVLCNITSPVSLCRQTQYYSVNSWREIDTRRVWKYEFFFFFFPSAGGSKRKKSWREIFNLSPCAGKRLHGMIPDLFVFFQQSQD